MRALALLLALFLAACGPQPAPPQQHATPALWVVRDADTTIYLFGTVHLLRPGLVWFDGKVRRAFDSSGELVLELGDPPQSELAGLLAEMGTDPSGPTLPSQLPPDTARKLADALAQLGEPAGSLDHAEPWYAAVLLSVLPIRQLGYDPSLGAERVLTTAAKREGKAVLGLETPREQFGYFDHLSLPAQRALLTTTLDGLPDTARTLDQLTAAWSKGDADTLARLVNEDVRGSPELAQALIVTRNHHWADWIARRMGKPGTVFVAVGAGHLAGADALQMELAKRGFRAARVP